MNVLLINPPMQINMQPEIPPFGLAYVGQELKRHGHSIEILDIDSNRFSKEEVIARLDRSSPDVLGIGGLVTVYPYLYWLIPQIRRLKPGKEIILGGAAASSLKERAFERFDIDYAVIGEGEVTAVELLKEISGSRNFVSVKGIGFRDKAGGNKTVFTEARPLMSSIDNVPFFDDRPFPMEKLLSNTKGAFQIHVQRGCPSNCTFCFNCYRVVSQKVRYRPVENVINEIEHFKKRFPKSIELFALSGECITMNKEWLISFCKELIRRGLKINYRITSRVNTLDEERLEWLKKSGCTRMSLGLESGSQKILNIMKKGATVEQGRKAVALSRRYIPNIEACVILGYVGENRETLSETVKFCKEIGIKPSLFFATPFPGTELYKMALEMGRIKDEEEYLIGLDKRLTFNLSLNLTEMPDAEAFDALSAAKREIERYYLWKEVKSMRIAKRVFLKFKEDGMKKTVGKMFTRVSEMMRR